MSLYVRLQTSFWNHRKTLRLKASIGDAALWVPPRLWSYAADNQPDGDFSGYSDEEIASILGYSGDASSMRQALLKAGFLDDDGKLHDWPEHNAYHETFSKRAKTAAKVRWEKEREKREEIERKRKEASIAASTATSMLQASEKLGVLYKRPAGKPLTYAEQSALAELSRREGFLGELAELEAFRLKPDSYFPQSIYALLSKWDETLDRARNATNRPNPKPSADRNAGTFNEGRSAEYAKPNPKVIR